MHTLLLWTSCALIVIAGVAKKLAEYYAEFLYPGKMLTEFTISAQHAFVSSAHFCFPVRPYNKQVVTYVFAFHCLQPTDDRGFPCNVFGPPFIVNCSYSAAHHLLNHIYGDVQYANASAAKTENVRGCDRVLSVWHAGPV